MSTGCPWGGCTCVGGREEQLQCKVRLCPGLQAAPDPNPSSLCTLLVPCLSTCLLTRYSASLSYRIPSHVTVCTALTHSTPPPCLAAAATAGGRAGADPAAGPDWRV